MYAEVVYHTGLKRHVASVPTPLRPTIT